MTKAGYVRYKGQWKTPQEIEILKNKQEMEAAQSEWMQKLKRWRGWLGTDRDQQGHDAIQSINSPAAAKALAKALHDDADPQVRMLMVEALARIDTPDAATALAVASIYDAADEVRFTCLDHLQTRIRPEVTAYYCGRLKDKDNGVVNRAGMALGTHERPGGHRPADQRGRDGP